MKFSVIIPVYNLEGYIIKCLESFTKQNFSPENFELVIVNDGSTDESLKVIENFVHRHRHINFRIFTKDNGGLSSARNFGLLKAKGKYIWFVDGDDWVPENSLSKLNQYLTEMPTLDILEFDCQLAIDTAKGLLYKSGGNPRAKSDEIETGRAFLEDHEYTLGVTIKIYRSDFLLKNNFLFPHGKYSEDNIFSLQTLLLAERYYKINEVYYFYYQRQNSITKTKTAQHLKRYYEDIMHNLQEMKIITDGESLAIQNTISRMSSFFVLLMMLDLIRNKKYNLVKYFAKEIKRNNFYPLVSLEMDYINNRKFDILRRIMNVYLKCI